MKFANDGTKNVVVFQEFGVNLRDLFENLGVRPEELSLFDEGANHIHAHGDSLGAVQDIRGHEGTVLGEGVRSSAPTAPL